MNPKDLLRKVVIYGIRIIHTTRVADSLPECEEDRCRYAPWPFFLRSCHNLEVLSFNRLLDDQLEERVPYNRSGAPAYELESFYQWTILTSH
jgi:hypothetical protein